MTVYQSVNELGEVDYVGVTVNLIRRAGEQFRSRGISVEEIPGLGSLSRFEARSSSKY
jgi:hypothetical protein